MKKQVSLIKVQGTFDGVTFYKKKGENAARLANGPSKELIATSPNFEKLRRRNQEFGGSMLPIKPFYKGLKKHDKAALGQGLSNKMGSIFRTMINRHEGERGKRALEILKNKELIEGLEFKSTVSFDESFSAPFTLTSNAERNVVTLTVPVFEVLRNVVRPTEVTHFQLINFVHALSDYGWNEEEKKYQPVNPELEGLFAREVSEYISLDEVNSPAITVTTTLPVAALNDTTALLCIIGIRFAELRGGKTYEDSTSAVMKIAKVF